MMVRQVQSISMAHFTEAMVVEIKLFLKLILILVNITLNNTCQPAMHCALLLMFTTPNQSPQAH